MQSFLAFGNKFSGPLPKTLGSAKSLQTLDLSENNLNGTIPANWGNASNLQFLLVRANNLSGAFCHQTL